MAMVGVDGSSLPVVGRIIAQVGWLGLMV